VSGVAALPSLPTLDEVNRSTPVAFAQALGPLFERAPRFLARLAAVRPFATWDELFARAEAIAVEMPRADQIELIDGHARLGADPASVRERSELSYREQGHGVAADRDGRADPAAAAERERVAHEIARLDDAYERRFGFRYVVFVAGRSRAELLPEMAAALDADRDSEIARALRDVVAIARDRRTRLPSR
jgi:2-oxo-4-hydroxy-4-carboxy--5-ureidoimidazoline (OHCU) decarboxylase